MFNNQMKVHYLIESLQRGNEGALSSSIASAQKFYDCDETAFRGSDLEFWKQVSDAPLPFPLTYTENPYGAVLFKEIDQQRFSFFIFAKNNPKQFVPVASGIAERSDSWFTNKTKLRTCLKHTPDSVVAECSKSQLLYALLMFKTLECSNVVAIKNVPPEPLNKKRRKSKKLPLFEYHTLHIVQRNRSQMISNHSSDRNSPRVHLRRGHIRHLESGRSLWIQACIVGDKSKGIVLKDYVVSINAH